MLLILGLTEAPLQKTAQVLPDGSIATFTFYYMPMQQNWFIRELEYEGRIIRNIRITTYPNVLDQWRNILPFGLACVTVDNRNPSFQEDFATGASKLYILDESDVDAYVGIVSLG
jgi:hypothetical protein